MDKPPIEELNYVGADVLKIGDIRIARGMTRRPRTTCTHERTTYDVEERRVWCSDCESEVEPFDAFHLIVRRLTEFQEALRRRLDELERAEAKALTLIAAKNLEREWRSRTTVPACPHCREALFPGLFKHSMHIPVVSKALAEQKRKG